MRARTERDHRPWIQDDDDDDDAGEEEEETWCMQMQQHAMANDPLITIGGE